MRNTMFQEPEVTGSLSDAWKQIRVSLIAPILYVALYACVAMSIMLFVERLYMTAVILYVKVLGKKRYTEYKLEALREQLEKNGKHPNVLIQIPCFVMQRVSIWKKIHLIYAFFFVRKIVAHWVTFFFYCVVIPACVLVPEVHLPKPLAIYIPAIITLLLVFWILFENVMSLHRTKAAIIGLLEANRVNEWVVTEKLLLQSGAFFTVAFGFVGTFVPSVQ